MNKKPFVTSKECSETNIGVFTTEASTLGFPPGFWPETIDTDMGNKMAFHRRADPTLNLEGDLEGFVYLQIAGSLRLHVIND